MNWITQLKKLEISNKWDEAIEFMQKIIKSDPNNVDAYICMNYLLMNLLVEEDYDESKHTYYVGLIKKYFDESYKKFHDDSKYLFFTGKTAYISEWYFGITLDQAKQMLDKAHTAEPNNVLYRWGRNIYDSEDALQKEKDTKLILQEGSEAHNVLISMGSIGEYLLDLARYWYENKSRRYD